MDRELAAMCDSTVKIEPYVSRTGAGDITYGPSYSLACLTVGKVKMVRTLEGQEKISDTQLFLDGLGAETLTPNDRLTLHNGVRRQIIGIGTYTEGGIVSLIEIYL